MSYKAKLHARRKQLARTIERMEDEIPDDYAGVRGAGERQRVARNRRRKLNGVQHEIRMTEAARDPRRQRLFC